MEKIIYPTLLAMFLCNHVIAMYSNNIEKEVLKVLNSVISNEENVPDLDLHCAQKILKKQCVTAQLKLIENQAQNFQSNLDHQLLTQARQPYDFKEISSTIFLLVAKVANVNVCCQAIRNTPLHWAIAFEHTYNAICLIFAGADVNATNCDGFTPLHLAAHYNQPTIAKILLKHGAKKDLLDKNGSTPLSIAKLFGFKKMIQLLSESGN